MKSFLGSRLSNCARLFSRAACYPPLPLHCDDYETLTGRVPTQSGGRFRFSIPVCFTIGTLFGRDGRGSVMLKDCMNNLQKDYTAIVMSQSRGVSTHAYNLRVRTIFPCHWVSRVSGPASPMASNDGLLLSGLSALLLSGRNNKIQNWLRKRTFPIAVFCVVIGRK
jgi:hypothetical protein